MANPWDGDEILDPGPSAPVARSTKAADTPWADDEVVEAAPGLEIEIRGGVREGTVAAPAQTARPSLFGTGSDFTDEADVGAGTMLVAAAKDMLGSRRGAAEYLAEKTGGSVESDVDGEPVLRLLDGRRYRLNDAGLDSTDIANVTGNVAAFALPAAGVAKVAQARQLGLGTRAIAQGVTGGAGDAALQAAFDNGRIDPMRVAASTAGGGLGEVVGTGAGALIRKGGERLRRVSGANAREVEQAAQAAGYQPTPEQVAQMAQGAEQIRLGADPRTLLGSSEFGLSYTQGQRLMDPVRKFDQLSREELLRQSPGGNNAFATMDRQNAEAVNNALANIGERVGGRPGATPAELAQGAASRVSQQAEGLGDRITDAYAKAGEGGRTAVSTEAVRNLPAMLRTSVAEFAPNATTTPATAKTLEQIALATDTILNAEGGKVAGVTLKALETQRRILNNNIGAAANPADRAALTKIKREFDGWLDESIDTALVSGDAGALKAIKEARALRSEFARRFEGRAEADKFIGGLLDGTRTPEELVNIALGASQVSKAGGARFIERLRLAADNDPAVIGNLRAAHFLRMTQGQNGQVVSMGQLVRNIRTTEYSNSSVIKALYQPSEWAEIRRLASSLEPLLPSGEFAKTSGTGERLARMLFQRVGGGVPIVGEVVRGVGSVVDAVRAGAAINAPLRLKVPANPAMPAIGAAGAREKAN